MLIRTTIVSFVLLITLTTLSKIWALLSFYQLPIELFSASGIEALLFGLRLDGTAAALLTAPIFILTIAATLLNRSPAALTRLFLSLAIIWIVATTFSDAIYAKDSGKHVTFELFAAKGMEVELLTTAFKSYWGTIVIGLVWSIICLGLVWKYLPLPSVVKPNKLLNGSFVFIWLFITVSLVRGGWSDHPQTPMRAYAVGNIDQAFISWNAPYSIGFYLSSGSLSAIKKITKDPTKSQTQALEKALQLTPPAQLDSLKSANVVVVLLESWPAYDMQSYSGVVDATPFFDQLRKRSLTTHSTYADAYRTVQGTFSTFCSYPNPINGFMANSQLQNYQYSCLPRILKDRGWQTTFVQGSGKGVVGTFAQTIGFNESFGKHDYPFEGVKNEWGYMDDDIYRFSLDQIDRLSQSTQPFLLTINTGTTHGSFLPENAGYTFGRENPIDERKSVVKYADDALKRFIPRLDAKLAELDKPTIVVLLADHTAKTVKGGFVKNAIPLLMYTTDQTIAPENRPITSSQRDIAPTIIDWLGGSVPWFTGHSLLDSSYKGRSSFSFGTGFFWMTKDHGIAINSATGELSLCFEIGKDVVSKKTVECAQQEWSQSLFAEGSYYNAISQKLLFDGKTTQYRKQITQP
jgi:phosphoglycerol transferase MdoB-like AlkP superfamily enzyme